MSLYRTWRPKSFTDLVGQDAVVRTLRTALVSGKLAHAYLFSGPRGSGKTSAAKILARCINCAGGPTPTPDNSCENCVAMLAGSALDVIEVDAASNRGIEEIRALRESVKFAPASMRMKVFIIDEAHMLTREGANAFLKTLEEPPPHAIFILATTAPEALPPTILSRCQRYAFRRIPVSVMIERMREISAAEGIAIDDGALGAIAYRADGGLRDALTMLEQVASYAGGAVDAATVDAAFGATGRQYARALVVAILSANARTALHIVDEASDAGADMLGLVRGAIGEYRNLLVARIDRDLLARDLSAADAEAVVALAGSTAQPRVVRGLRLLADALAAGRSSGNPRLELETAVLRLIVQGEDPSLEALATRVSLLESGAATAAPMATMAPAATVAPMAPLAERGSALASSCDVKADGRNAASPSQSPVTNAVASSPVRDEAEPAPTSVALPPSPTSTSFEHVESAETIFSSIAASGGANEGASVGAHPTIAPDGVKPPSADPPVINAEADVSAPDAPTLRIVPARVAALTPIERDASVASDDATSAPPPPAASAPTLQQVRSLWDQIRLRAEEKHKPLRALLSRATVDSVDGDAVVIGVGDGIQEGLARDKTPLIEAAVSDVLRARLRVIVRVRGAASAASRTSASSSPAPGASATAERRFESPVGANGEIDLLAYARKKLGGTESP